MSLISINDPGVFTDVYCYCHLVDQQYILDVRKRGLRSFHTWYNDNRDTLDFVLHNQDHTEASKLLLSFHAHYKKEADKYNLDVKHFGNLVQEIKGHLVDARVMQHIHAHNFHVWKAIEGSGAKETYWGLHVPKPCFDKNKQCPILPPNAQLLEVPSALPLCPPSISPASSHPPLPTSLPPPLPVPSIEQCAPEGGPHQGQQENTPLHVEDRTANDSKRGTPLHMPKEHFPRHSPSPVPAASSSTQQ